MAKKRKKKVQNRTKPRASDATHPSTAFTGPPELRLHDMGRAVQGAITPRRDEPAPESDGYDASLEAMFEGLG